jgi:acyl carrier protein
MNDTAILENLKKILHEHTAIKVELTAKTALLGQQVLDSMDFMNYLVAIETEYGLTISDEDIAAHQLGIMGNMARYIGERAA